MYQVAIASWNTPNEFNLLSYQMCFMLVPVDQTNPKFTLVYSEVPQNNVCCEVGCNYPQCNVFETKKLFFICAVTSWLSIAQGHWYFVYCIWFYLCLCNSVHFCMNISFFLNYLTLFISDYADVVLLEYNRVSA